MQEVQTINDDLLGSNYCYKINLPPDISSVGFLSCAVDQRSGERLTLEMSALNPRMIPCLCQRGRVSGYSEQFVLFNK